MAELTAWRFETPDGAENAPILLERLGHGLEPPIDAAATVVWEIGRTPVLRTLANDSNRLTTDFWSLLLGFIFLVPLLGANLREPTGARPSLLAELGIEDAFVNKLRDKVTPGTSALFVFSSAHIVDDLHDALSHGPRCESVTTSLSNHHEAAIRAVFGS